MRYGRVKEIKRLGWIFLSESEVRKVGQTNTHTLDFQTSEQKINKITFAEKLTRTSRLFILFLLLVSSLKWAFIFVTPVWDEAFSVFPAADFLVKHNFDYALLLEQPGYHEGGPTAHALSLLTFVTAVVLKATGGGMWAWTVLHMIQWLMASAIGVLLTKIYNELFDVIPSLLLAVLTLVYPLMLAQLGGMYIEVPLLFLSLLALHQYRKNRVLWASLLLMLACMTKESGIIAVFALVMLSLHSNGKSRRRKYEEVFILALPAMVFILIDLMLVNNSISPSISQNSTKILDIIILRNLAVYKTYIVHIPELIYIVPISVLMAIFFLIHEKQKRKTGRKTYDIITYNSYFLITFFCFHFLIYPFIQVSDSHFLSRYFFYAIPSIFFLLYLTIDKLISQNKIKISLLIILIGVSLFNRDGILYPTPTFASIAISERSEEYIDGYKVQKELLKTIEKQIPDDLPIYTGLPEYFLAKYSVSGYVSKPLPNVCFIGHVLRQSEGKINYPDKFVLVYHYPWLGGSYIAKLIKDFSQKKEYSTQMLAHVTEGNFSAYIFEVKYLFSEDEKLQKRD